MKVLSRQKKTTSIARQSEPWAELSAPLEQWNVSRRSIYRSCRWGCGSIFFDRCAIFFCFSICNTFFSRSLERGNFLQKTADWKRKLLESTTKLPHSSECVDPLRCKTRTGSFSRSKVTVCLILASPCNRRRSYQVSTWKKKVSVTCHCWLRVLILRILLSSTRGCLVVVFYPGFTSSWGFPFGRVVSWVTVSYSVALFLGESFWRRNKCDAGRNEVLRVPLINIHCRGVLRHLAKEA